MLDSGVNSIICARMEPATKRRKTAGALTDTDEDDELFLEPEELNQRRDPAFQLAVGRAKAATQLKSRFEDIFAKYGKDFTGVGDEIDLATGEVVVDNGHLSSMRSMKDWIVDDDVDDDNDNDDEGEGEEEKIPAVVDNERSDSANGTLRGPYQTTEPSWPSESGSRGPHPLESLLPTQFRFTHPSHSFPIFSHESSINVDPTWQAPELPPPAIFGRPLGSNGRHYGGATPVATRTVLRKSLKAPESPEADDEDHIQTASSNAPESKDTRDPHKTRESPLINNKFPTVDSSPQDNGLNNLIQDVIENIPDTPPSIRRPKSQGKPSPLNQQQRIHSRTGSKLRISDTPLNGHSRKAPKKRDSKHKVPAVPVVEDTSRSPLVDHSSWEQSDLESFLDITSQGITKPGGQVLYVDIRASSSIRKGMSPTEDPLRPHTIDAEPRGSIAYGDLPVDLLVQDPEPMDAGITALDHYDQNASTTTDIRQPREPSKLKPQAQFEKNVVDPAFDFSDEETLLPKRLRKEKPQQNKHARGAIIPRRPIREPDNPKQEIVDERVAACEHEPISFVREKAATRCRTKTSNDGSVGAESPMLVDTAGVSDQLQATQLLSHQAGPSQRHPRKRTRAGPFNSLPNSPSRSPVRSGSQNSYQRNVVDQSYTFSDEERPLPRRTRRNVRGSAPVSTIQEAPLPVEEAETDNKVLRSRRHMAKKATDQSEPREKQTVMVKAMKADDGIRTSNLRSRSRKQSQHQSPTVSKPSPPAESQSHPPATPQGPRSKWAEEKTPTSFSTSILSLLSDSDDDEDEISFDHSDFTPSGHHRILVHRPFPQLSTTPRISMSGMNKKKKRASLLHSRSHSASSHRISKTSPTPRSAGSDAASNARHRRKHHKSSRPLARSVVQVLHRRDRDQDREASLVETPGGSKRRCGVGGWKCERDFCFVCME